MVNVFKFIEDIKAQRLVDIFPVDHGQINAVFYNDTQKITAWHRHKKQTDYVICLKGSFVVGLSKTNNNPDNSDVIYGLGNWKELREQEVLSDKNFRVLEIPPDTWHGWRALEPDSILLYYMTEKYDTSDIEESPVLVKDWWF